MPIYEYQCASRQCLHCFEVLQKIDEPDPAHCPKCKQASLSRALNAPRFQLKGAGWYVSDFRDSDKPAPGKANTDPNKAKADEGASATASKDGSDKSAEGASAQTDSGNAGKNASKSNGSEAKTEPVSAKPSPPKDDKPGPQATPGPSA